MRAACYSRVSTDEQAREGVSLDLQRDRCSLAAQAAGATDVVHYSDEGYSGSRAENRPALQQLLADLSNYDAVYVWRLDRLTRRNRDAAQLIEHLADHGVRLVSVSEGFDFSSILGRAMAQVASVFAELEVETIRERVRDALGQILRTGRTLGAVPYGYQRNGSREPLAIEPTEAEAVRAMFALYDGGASLVQVCYELTRRGHVPRDADRWTAAQVGKVLSRATYLGEVYIRALGESVPGLHPPLVDRDLWHRVQQRRQRNRRAPGEHRSATLAPLYRCGYCGGIVSIVRSTLGRSDSPQYRCEVRQQTAPESRHEPWHLATETCDALLWLLVEELITEAADHAYRARQASRRQRTRQAQRLARLRAQRDETLASITYNLEAARAGAIPASVLAAQNAPLQQELASLERALETEQQQAQWDPSEPGLRERMVAIRQGSVVQQREFLRAVYREVRLSRGCMEVELVSGEVVRLAVRRKQRGWKGLPELEVAD